MRTNELIETPKPGRFGTREKWIIVAIVATTLLVTGRSRADMVTEWNANLVKAVQKDLAATRLSPISCKRSGSAPFNPY